MAEQLKSDQPSYNEVVEVISKLELVSPNPKETTISILQTMGEPSKKSTQNPAFSELVSIIETAEAKNISDAKKAAKEEQQTQRAAMQSSAQQNRQIEMKKVVPYIEKEANAAKAELERLAKKIHIPKFQISIKNHSDDALVFPKLSVSDQISELEKIINGVKGNGFDSAHLKVIEKEMKGLKEIIGKERKLVSENKMQLSDLERPLWDLRNQRFDEANMLIHK